MLKIIIADKQTNFRKRAAKVLAVEKDFSIVAQCETAERMMVAIESFRAAILVFSSALRADLSKLIEQTKKLKTRLVIVIESNENAAQYLQMGISGVVYRNIGGPALVECVRKVSRGEIWTQNTEAAAVAN